MSTTNFTPSIFAAIVIKAMKIHEESYDKEVRLALENSDGNSEAKHENQATRHRVPFL